MPFCVHVGFSHMVVFVWFLLGVVVPFIFVVVLRVGAGNVVVVVIFGDGVVWCCGGGGDAWC